MNVSSISIVMNGIKKCSGACLYCSASKSMGYRSTKNESTFKFYPDKLKQRILEFCAQDLENGKAQDGTQLNIDIWGGNPLENFAPFKQVVKFCENELKEFKLVKLHTSGNGLELQDRDLVDYLITHRIGYQLSHDGLGQWLRTGEIDPITWDKTKDNIVELAREGILDWINCTLSSRNPSFFDNIKYWNDWRQRNNLMSVDLTIKLNHVYDGTTPINKKWLGKDNPQIKNGEEIGDLCFHGDILQEYLHEFRKLALICMTPDIEKDLNWRPYVGYIIGQAERYKLINKPEEAGSCVAFQRGLKDRNFPIDTKGEYCQCNLIDSDSKVLNPTAKQADYCKGCKYEKLAECNPCGSENFPEKCEYHWWWAKTLEETFQMLELRRIMMSQNNVNQCNCKDKNKEPVFCVKNYM